MGTQKDITVKALIWDKHNREHIAKHQVHPHHVEEVTRDPYKAITEAKKGRFMLVGRCGKRLLSVLLGQEGKKFYVVTARDADKRERNIYRNHGETLSSS